MNKTTKTLIVLGILASTVLGGQVALAHERGDGQGGLRNGWNRQGGLVSSELREEWRAERKVEFANLTDEERQALREEMKTKRAGMHEEKKQAFLAFSGLTADEVKEARQSGESIGDILEAQGITEEDAEAFITARANDKVDTIVERHNLDEDKEQTLRERVSTFIGKILSKWFGGTD